MRRGIYNDSYITQHYHHHDEIQVELVGFPQSCSSRNHLHKSHSHDLSGGCFDLQLEYRNDVLDYFLIWSNFRCTLEPQAEAEAEQRQWQHDQFSVAKIMQRILTEAEDDIRKRRKGKRKGKEKEEMERKGKETMKSSIMRHCKPKYFPQRM